MQKTELRALKNEAGRNICHRTETSLATLRLGKINKVVYAISNGKVWIEQLQRRSGRNTPFLSDLILVKVQHMFLKREKKSRWMHL